MSTETPTIDLDVQAQILARDLVRPTEFMRTSLGLDHTAVRLRKLIQGEIKAATEPEKTRSMETRILGTLSQLQEQHPSVYDNTKILRIHTTDWRVFAAESSGGFVAATIWHYGKPWIIEHELPVHIGTLQFCTSKVSLQMEICDG